MGLWYRARKEAGIDDVRLHDLRHTVASQAVARGIALSTVARMLGHSDPTMTLAAIPSSTRYAALAIGSADLTRFEHRASLCPSPWDTQPVRTAIATRSWNESALAKPEPMVAGGAGAGARHRFREPFHATGRPISCAICEASSG